MILIYNKGEKMNNKIAFNINNNEMSYNALYETSGKIRKALGKISENDIVSIAVDNKVMYAASVIAVWDSGCKAFCLDASYPDTYRKKLLEMSGSSILIDDTFINKALSEEIGITVKELSSGDMLYSKVINDKLSICELSSDDFESRYDFCCNVLKVDFSSNVSVIGNKELFLSLFVLRSGGTIIDGTDAKTIISSVSMLDKKGLLIKDDSVILSYGEYIAERSLKEHFNSRGIKMYNIFDHPSFCLVSSGFNFDVRPVKGIKTSIVNEIGASQPDGMTGLLIYDINGNKINSGYIGQKVGKGTIKLNPDTSNSYINDEKISVSLLLDVIKSMDGVSDASSEFINNNIYILCDTDLPLADIIKKVSEKFPSAYLGIHIIKASDKKYCGKVYDMNGLEKLRSILKRFELNLDSVKDKPYSVCIECLEENRKEISDLLAVSRMVANVVFKTSNGVEEECYSNDFPEGSTEAIVLSAFREVLENDNVGLFDNFFEKGGNSIGFIRLATMIEEKNGAGFNANALFLEPTPKRCCELIFYGDSDNGVSYDRELTLKNMIADTAISPVIPENKKTNSDNIFFTGATGFLGVFLLRSLLRKTDRKIYCLVRAEDQAAGLNRLRSAMEKYGLENEFDDKRIIAVPGDLEKEKLGISDELYNEIAENSCCIVHNGAKVDFMYTYDMLKKANVDSVKEVIKLAATGAEKEIHYISTLAILGDCMYEGDADEDFINYDYPPMISGYNQSKWVGDALVQNSRTYGIKANIYRISTACGDSVNGYWQENDLVKSICKICIKMKKAAIFEFILHLIPVDRMADMIAYCIDKKIEDRGRNFHICGGKELSIKEVLGWINDEGFTVDIIPDIEWISEAYKYVSFHKNDFKSKTVFSVVNKTEDFDFEFKCNVCYDKTEEYFEKEGVPHGKLTKEEFKKCMKKIKEEIEAEV